MRQAKITVLKETMIKQFIFLIILSTGIFFRFYNYFNRITFDTDSTRDAFVAFVGSQILQFPLTGPFISIAPVTTGPWYWYQLIIAKILLQTYFAPWIYLGILSSLLIIIYYRIGTILESAKFGLILSFIVALSPQQIRTAYFLTNPSTIGFFSTLVFLIFFEIILRRRPTYWGLLLGAIIGLTLNSHFQSAPLVLFIIFLIFYNKYKTAIYALVGFLVTLMPLLFFELNNHWYNTRNIIDYLLFGQFRICISVRWLTYIYDFWPRFWVFVTGGAKYLGLFIMIASFLVFIKKILNKSAKTKLFILLAISFLIEVIIIRYYRGEKFFGYLQFFHPYIFLLTGYVLYSFFEAKKGLFVGFLVLATYLYMVLPSSLDTLKDDELTEEIKKIHKQVIDQLGDKEYALFNCQHKDINLVRGLDTYFYIKNNFNENSNQKLLIYNGRCNFPDIENNNLASYKYFKADFIYDVSNLSEPSLLEKGVEKFSPKKEFQSSARWWFDEKP